MPEADALQRSAVGPHTFATGTALTGITRERFVSPQATVCYHLPRMMMTTMMNYLLMTVIIALAELLCSLLSAILKLEFFGGSLPATVGTTPSATFPAAGGGAHGRRAARQRPAP